MEQLRTAVIMAGGMGTRLSKICGKLPKAMVNIRGTAIENYGLAKDTILEHQIGCLSENGIKDFILVVGNKKEFIKNAFSSEIMNKAFPGRDINIRFFEESAPLGTAGAFCSKELRDMVEDDNFLFTYSDVLFDVNVQEMNKVHCKENADATVLISPCAEPDDRPLCVCEKGSNEISSLIPKQGKNDGPRGSIFPNTPKNGMMILSKSFFELMPEEPTYLDMEEGILTKLIYSDRYKVCAWNTPCYIKDIGTVDRYYEGVIDLDRNLPASKNPAKTLQCCAVFREKDLIQFDNNGYIHVDQNIASSIATLNNSGVITFLQNDEPALNGQSREDEIVDTLLIREGNGAFVNHKFQEGDINCLLGKMNEWSIPLDRAFYIEKDSQVEGFNMVNMGSYEGCYFSDMQSATANMINKLSMKHSMGSSQDCSSFDMSIEQ